MPLYREQLDQLGCSTPGCDHSSHDSGMFLHGRCHMGAGTWAEYRKGLVRITCAKCKAHVATIAVASEPVIRAAQPTEGA